MAPASDRGIPDSAEQQHSASVTESDMQAMSRKPLAEQETGVTRADKDNQDNPGLPDSTRVDIESDSGCGTATDIPGIIITEASGESGQVSESADGADDNSDNEDGAFVPHDSGDVGQPAAIRAGVSRHDSDKEPSWIHPDLYERLFSNGRVILAVAAALWAVVEFLILPHV
jgi:hypothetical protein